jgi:hypothetical protein
MNIAIRRKEKGRKFMTLWRCYKRRGKDNIEYIKNEEEKNKRQG